MPLVTVKMLEGRTDEQNGIWLKSNRSRKRNDRRSRRKIIVMIEEMRKDHYAVAGKRISDTGNP